MKIEHKDMIAFSTELDLKLDFNFDDIPLKITDEILNQKKAIIENIFDSEFIKTFGKDAFDHSDNQYAIEQEKGFKYDRMEIKLNSDLKKLKERKPNVELSEQEDLKSASIIKGKGNHI